MWRNIFFQEFRLEWQGHRLIPTVWGFESTQMVESTIDPKTHDFISSMAMQQVPTDWRYRFHI